MAMPKRIDLLFKLSVPSIIPANMAAKVSPKGLPKWTIQYGMVEMKME